MNSKGTWSEIHAKSSCAVDTNSCWTAIRTVDDLEGAECASCCSWIRVKITGDTCQEVSRWAACAYWMHIASIAIGRNCTVYACRVICWWEKRVRIAAIIAVSSVANLACSSIPSRTCLAVRVLQLIVVIANVTNSIAAASQAVGLT